jgi:hypothetical protein
MTTQEGLPALETDAELAEWPENPDAAWLGEWAAKQDDLPYVVSLRICRELYQSKRRAALEAKSHDD